MDLLSRAQSDLRVISDEASNALNRLKRDLASLFDDEIDQSDNDQWVPTYPNYFLKMPERPKAVDALVTGHLLNKWENIIGDYRSKIFRGNSPLRLQRTENVPNSSTRDLEDKIRELEEQNKKLRHDVDEDDDDPAPLPNFTPAPVPFSLPPLYTSPAEEDQYDISPWEDSDAEAQSQKTRAEREEEKREIRAKKHIPEWCLDYKNVASRQNDIDPDGIFFCLKKFPKCDLQVIFGTSEKIQKAKRRGSSGNWGIDGLTDLEIDDYKRKMGQRN